jgi:hypothetical protein
MHHEIFITPVYQYRNCRFIMPLTTPSPITDHPGTHKTIEKEVISAMLPLVLDTHRAPHITLFLEFLGTSTHQRITLDQWDSFLQFQYSVNLDLSNYDEDGACKYMKTCYFTRFFSFLLNILIFSY